jgi:hypothetical protein
MQITRHVLGMTCVRSVEWVASRPSACDDPCYAS